MMKAAKAEADSIVLPKEDAIHLRNLREAFIEVGPVVIAIESDLQPVHEALAFNFGSRYSIGYPASSRTLLHCRVIGDPEAYRTAATAIKFDGPAVPLRAGITIQYGFGSTKTWLEVTRAAIIELDAHTPTQCKVLVHPDALASYSHKSMTEAKKRATWPEAFFYPMLAEWLRSFDACLVHCGAVALNGRTIFLTGQSGSGKSTQILRMLVRGASFIADDLAVLYSQAGGLRLMPFREVANLEAHAIQAFPELSPFRNAPDRGDGKYCVSVPERFPTTPITEGGPGIVLRLNPEETPDFRPVPLEQSLDNMYQMAWFGSRPESNKAHFNLLTDWLFQSEQWHVSRGFMRECLDELMSRLSQPGDIGGSV